MPDFTLDARLAADSFALGAMRLCDIRLMDDRRWPWLLVIPRRAALTELDQLTPSDLTTAISECTFAARVLRAVCPCDKINVGALGNIVRQLHLHVVARRADDTNWPGPVWGFGEREPYDTPAQRQLVADLRARLFPARTVQ